MQLPRLFFVSMLVLTTTLACGQSKEEFSGPFPNAPKPEAGKTVAKKSIFSRHRVKAFTLKKQNVRHTAQYEYYKRVEVAAKEHQRTLRKLAKPQYSNFLYYGHKRKPRKRPPEKMRFCDECGIRH